MTEKILITGGAGFIGSHLTEYHVKQGNQVIVIDNLCRGNKIPKDILKDVNLIQKDVRNAEVVLQAATGCKHIYHLAAVLGVDIVADNPVETMEVETIGTKNVADAAIKKGVEKIIYASTSGIYGHSAIEKSVTEDITVDPRTSYSIAKRFNEIYLLALSEEKSLPSVSLRFFNVYGKRQDTRMVLPRFFDQALKGQPITVYGEGAQTRDFTYIDDTIQSAVLLANNPNIEGIFNVARGTEISISDLAKIVKKVTSSESEIEYLPSPKKRYDFEVERRVGDSSKLESVTGYRPQTNLEEGIKKMEMIK